MLCRHVVRQLTYTTIFFQSANHSPNNSLHTQHFFSGGRLEFTVPKKTFTAAAVSEVKLLPLFGPEQVINVHFNPDRFLLTN